MACTKVAGYHKLYYAPAGVAHGNIVATNYLGTTGPEGIRLNRETLVQEITSDELGPEAIVDGVFQGSNVTLEFVVQDVNKSVVQALIHPFQTLTSVVTHPYAVEPEKVGVAGRLACGVQGILVAMPVTGSPAATFGTDSEGSDTPIINKTSPAGRRFKGINVGPVLDTLDTTPRFVPVRFQVYPYDWDSDGVLRHWQWVSSIGMA